MVAALGDVAKALKRFGNGSPGAVASGLGADVIASGSFFTAAGGTRGATSGADE
jgi:hypothetical protein